MQPFLGYSPSGKAEGELVYVNYGRVQDFEQLKNLSVNVTGRIAIMRYGKIFRGNKVIHTGLGSLFGCILITVEENQFCLMIQFKKTNDSQWEATIRLLVVPHLTQGKKSG